MSTFEERADKAYGYDVRPIVYPSIGDSYLAILEELPIEKKDKDGKMRPLVFTVDINDENRDKLLGMDIKEGDKFSTFMSPVFYREIRDIANKKKLRDPKGEFSYLKKAKLLITAEEYKNAKESIYNVKDEFGRVIMLHVRDIIPVWEYDKNQKTLPTTEEQPKPSTSDKPIELVKW